MSAALTNRHNPWEISVSLSFCSVFHSSNLHDDLQVRSLGLVLTRYLQPGHLCCDNNTPIPSSCTPSLSFSFSLCCCLGAERPHCELLLPRRPFCCCRLPVFAVIPPPIKFPVLQDTDPPVPWASCRGGHSPIILPSKVATWRSVSGQARWLCAV